MTKKIEKISFHQIGLFLRVCRVFYADSEYKVGPGQNPTRFLDFNHFRSIL